MPVRTVSGDVNRQIERTLIAPSIRFDLVEDEWNFTSERVFLSDNHNITYRFPSKSRGELLIENESGAVRCEELGTILWIPADVPLRMRGVGGKMRLARLVIEIGCYPVLDQLVIDKRARIASCCADVRNERVAQGMLRIIEEAKNSGYASEAMFESLARVVAMDLARHIYENLEEAVGGTPFPSKTIDEIRRYIVANMRDRISVGMISSHFGFSERQFSRLFNASTGVTVSRYIDECRIERAKKLLMSPQTNSKRIAHEIGYASVPSFSTAFRRITGNSPSSYRNMQLHYLRGANHEDSDDENF